MCSRATVTSLRNMQRVKCQAAAFLLAGLLRAMADRSMLLESLLSSSESQGRIGMSCGGSSYGVDREIGRRREWWWNVRKQ